MKWSTWLLVAVLAFVAVTAWNFWLAVCPPRITLVATPRDYQLPFEDVVIRTADGIRLAAWLIPAAIDSARPPRERAAAGSDRAAVIVLHGYPAEKADMLAIAAALHGDFATLLVDLRYFGRSDGRVTTLGHRERGDVAHAVDFLIARGFTRVGVFGYSLGGAVAILGAADDPRVSAIAAYAPFADLRVLGRDLYGIFWLLKYPLVGAMTVWSRVFLGADITRPSPEQAAGRLAMPVLLMASEQDEQIPFHHAERLRDALRTNGRAEIRFGRGRHNDRAPDFERHLREFFVRALR